MKVERIIKSPLLVATFGLLISSASVGDCKKAEPPMLPDAAVATEKEMKMAHSQVKQYIERNKNYVSCVVSTKKKKRSFREIKRVAREFNKVLKQYQARNDNNSEGETAILASK